MRKEVQEGNTIIVSGPASATIVEGKAMVLGMELTVGQKMVVRRGKSLPLEAEGNTILDIVLGAEANVNEVEGSTIPDSWRKAVAEVLSHQKPCTVMVLGDVDAGKTSFSTFLINKSLQYKVQPSIIDVDLGQSDIGPPTSIGLSLVSKPVADLFSEKPAAIFFMGQTSAQGITQRVGLGLEAILNQVPLTLRNLTVINTDGWISGDGAHSYKRWLIRKARSDIIVGIQRSDELEPILNPLEKEGFKTLRLSASPAVKKRGKEERQALREQSYKKYLGEPNLRSLQMNWVELEYTPLGQGNTVDITRLVTLEKALRNKVVYCEESVKELFIVLDKKGRVDEEDVSAAETLYQKDVYIVREGDENGLLVSLLNNNREFLGLGILSKLDYKNRDLKIWTSYKDEVSIVQFGQVKISESGNELGIVTSFSSKIKGPTPVT